jgi:hypothetical protein
MALLRHFCAPACTCYDSGPVGRIAVHLKSRYLSASASGAAPDPGPVPEGDITEMNPLRSAIKKTA